MTQLKTRDTWTVGEVVEEYIQYRGPARFRVQIRQGGVTENRTFKTLEDARKFKIDTLHHVLGNKHVDTRLAERTSLAEACRWAMSIDPATGRAHMDKNDANWKNHKARLKWWRDKSRFRNWMLVGKPNGKKIGGIHDYDLKKWVTDVTAVDFGDDEEDAAAAAIELGKMEGYDGPIKPVKNQTICHRLATLSVLYQTWRQAHNLDPMQCPNPSGTHIRPSIKADRREARRLRPGELQQLLKTAKMSSRPWLEDAIVIAVETAMRQTELATLYWENVHLDCQYPYARLLKTKNGEPREPPLSPVAIAAFRHLKELADRHNAERLERISNAATDVQRAAADAMPTWDKPLPIATGRGIIHAFRDAISDAQQRAQEADDPDWASIHDDLRWHDLRHEAVSRMFQDSDPPMRAEAVMAIVGHLSKDMLNHYLKMDTPKLGVMLPGAKAAEPAEPEMDAKAGSLKLGRGQAAKVKDADGKWVTFDQADEIIRAYAAKALKAALAELEALEVAD